MDRTQCVVLAAVSLAAPAVAQQRCFANSRNFNCSTIQRTNAVGGPVEWPNFRSPGGNHADDRLWKVFPKELFLRAEHTAFLTGGTANLLFANLDTQALAYFPGIELRRVVATPQGWLVPDFSVPPIVYVPFQPNGGAYIFGPGPLPIRWDFASQWGIQAIPEDHIALALRAPTGQGAATVNAVMPARSTLERYDRVPQPSFSGRYNGATRQWEFLAPPVVPERCELHLDLDFVEGVLQFGVSTAGGNPADPGEHFLGVGAMYNDLALRGGRVRLRFEGLGDSQIYHWLIPLLGFQRSPTLQYIPGLPCPTDINLGDPLALSLLTSLGPVPLQERGRYTGWWNCFGSTPWIEVPADPSLIGGSVFAAGIQVTWLGDGLRLMTLSNTAKLSL